VKGVDDIEFVTAMEVARALRVSRMTVYRCLNEGSIASVRIGRSFRIPMREFERIQREGINPVPLNSGRSREER
jgi:excisionase family DNA binding protein